MNAIHQKKAINYITIDEVNLEEAIQGDSKIFQNQHISIVLNGNPMNSTLLRRDTIYHVAEERIILFLNGSAELSVNLESGRAERGTVMLFPSDSIVDLHDFSDDVKVIALVTREKLPTDDILILPTSPEDFAELLRMVYLTWDIAQHTPFRKEAVLSLVQAMVGNILCIDKENPHDAGHHGGSRQEEIFKEFKRLVNQHCERERTIPFYAEQLHITPHHLSAVIKQTSGQSVMFWLNRAIILRAKVLLNTQSVPTYEVANRLNFSSPSAFHNFFKRVTGMTPKEYQTKEG